MPTIEISKKDLEKLVGKKLKKEEIEELLQYAKAEYDGDDGDTIKVDCADTNRPDLWSVEGIARQIRGGLGKDLGVPYYNIHKSNFFVRVEPAVKNIRPRIACAVLKDVNITDEVIKQIIQMQEKITTTFGRNRKEAAIGVYDFDKIKWPIRYTAYAPDALKFVPLEFEREMTLKQILRTHPKGREFTHLLDGCNKYPIFIDSAKNVLSMPPIINSNYSGKVTESTKNLFIEVSGYEDVFVHTALNVIVAALADRGAKIYEVKVKYGLSESQICPNFKPKRASLRIESFNALSGLRLSVRDVMMLLKRARMNTKLFSNAIIVDYPSCRQDILHEADLIEDALISYGYNNIEPEVSELAVVGSSLPIERFSRKIREFLVGFGAQEIATYSLTNKSKLFNKMNLISEKLAASRSKIGMNIPNQKCMEIANPVSQNWCVLRNWLIPSVVDFLSSNTTKEYPQLIFEVGDVVLPDSSAETMSQDKRRLAFAISHQKANFTELKQVLRSLLEGLGLEFTVDELDHDSFTPGRVGSIKVKGKEVGIIGELHPQVLHNWKLENPVVVFEIDLTQLLHL